MDFDVTTWSCSFCGSQGTEGTRFAGGLGVLMCERCLTSFQGSLVARDRTGPRIIWLSDEAATNVDLVERLPRIAAAASQVGRYLRMFVRQAHQRGISYGKIGQALGVSRQAAWERFSKR